MKTLSDDLRKIEVDYDTIVLVTITGIKGTTAHEQFIRTWQQEHDGGQKWVIFSLRPEKSDILYSKSSQELRSPVAPFLLQKNVIPLLDAREYSQASLQMKELTINLLNREVEPGHVPKDNFCAGAGPTLLLQGLLRPR